MDLNKTGAAILVEQYNIDNPSVNLPAPAVTFNAPVANNGPDSAQRDTKITMSAVPGSGYTGSVNLTYPRLDIETDIVDAADRPVTFDEGEATRVAGIVAEFNTRFRVNLVAGTDYTDADLPEFDGTPNETKTFTLTMLASSLIYKGDIVITVALGDIDLQDATSATQMSGPDYTPPPA